MGDETAPLGIDVTWEFPEREEGKLPPMKLTWRDGDLTPKHVAGHDVPGAGVMFIGEKGHLFADYGGYRLYPEDQFKDFQAPPQTIPASEGHYVEWIKACKEGSPTTCNFDYSGALTETVLLGNVAFRSGATEKIAWDAANLKVTNNDVAQRFIQRDYRKGWTL